MFHRSCESLRTSLLARISDLESENRDLLDRLMTEREAASRRELELTDRILAVANPLAVRLMRSAEPASPLPMVERGGSTASPRRAGVRPMLSPTAANFRPLTDLMGSQQRRAVERAVSGPEPDSESDPESASEPTG